MINDERIERCVADAIEVLQRLLSSIEKLHKKKREQSSLADHVQSARNASLAGGGIYRVF